jgi:hypothetical protein
MSVSSLYQFLVLTIALAACGRRPQCLRANGVRRRAQGGEGGAGTRRNQPWPFICGVHTAESNQWVRGVRPTCWGAGDVTSGRRGQGPARVLGSAPRGAGGLGRRAADGARTPRGQGATRRARRPGARERGAVRQFYFV